jgi:hypothetical protein
MAKSLETLEVIEDDITKEVVYKPFIQDLKGSILDGSTTPKDLRDLIVFEKVESSGISFTPTSICKTDSGELTLSTPPELCFYLYIDRIATNNLRVFKNGEPWIPLFLMQNDVNTKSMILKSQFSNKTKKEELKKYLESTKVCFS